MPRALARIANPEGLRDDTTEKNTAILYPALILLYSGGVAAAANEYLTLASLLEVKLGDRDERPVALRVYPTRNVDEELNATPS